jgi:hypothetical protein
MRAKVYITIEDDTTEERLIASGMSRERMHDLYYNAFQRLLGSFVSPGCRADLRVVVDDGKERK